MRSSTINQITVYLLIGLAVNFVIILFSMYFLHMHDVDFLLTIIGVNLCYIAVARDVSRKFEQISSLKSRCHKPPEAHVP